VTWYSKLLSVVLFILVLPTFTFYLGMQYESVTKNYSIVPQPSVKPPANSSLVENLNYELLKSKFEKAILEFWGVRQVFETPLYKNRFYYISSDSTGSTISYYDTSLDKGFNLEAGTFDIVQASVRMYHSNFGIITPMVQPPYEFRGTGFDGNKFVFYKVSTDDSPGPCSDDWLRDNLQYIDVSNPVVIVESYILPSDRKAQKEIDFKNCQNSL
jgi:hypothetical protein